jgi:hypothetical protein
MAAVTVFAANIRCAISWRIYNSSQFGVQGRQLRLHERRHVLGDLLHRQIGVGGDAAVGEIGAVVGGAWEKGTLRLCVILGDVMGHA